MEPASAADIHRRKRLNTSIIVCDNQAHGSILYAQWQQFDGDVV